MSEQELESFPNEFGPHRLNIAQRLISVAFGITAVTADGAQQKVPGSGVFIAPYLAITAKHVMLDIVAMLGKTFEYGTAQPIGIKLHQLPTLDPVLFRSSRLITWDVKAFIECPYSDLALLDVVPANDGAEALAKSRWNEAMFRIRMLPPPVDQPIRAFGFPAKSDWSFDPVSRQLNTTSDIAYSEGRVTEVFDDWRVAPAAPPPAILGLSLVRDNQKLTDFPCFEMTTPVESGMSGAPVFHGDDLYGIVSTGIDLDGEIVDASQSRAASLWPLIYMRNIPTGLGNATFHSLLRSALINCPDWRDAEQTTELVQLDGKPRVRRSHGSG